MRHLPLLVILESLVDTTEVFVAIATGEHLQWWSCMILPPVVKGQVHFSRLVGEILEPRTCGRDITGLSRRGKAGGWVDYPGTKIT